MPKQPPIILVGSVGLIMVTLTAALGFNAQPLADLITKILIWMLPSAILGAIAGGLASKVYQEALAPLGIGLSVATLTLLFRGIFWVFSVLG